MTITQNRLATGKKVNTALDNPVNFFTASGLQSRASDLSALLDAMGSGVKTLQAADNGLTAITTTINSMQSTLLQARQDRSFKTQSYGIGTVGLATVKNLTLSGGSVGAVPVSIPLNAADVGGSITTVSTSANYVAPAAATQPLLTAGSAFTALDVSNGNESYTFNVVVDGGSPAAITLNSAADTSADGSISEAEAVASINTQLATASSHVRVRDSLTSAGKLEFYVNSGSHTGAGSSIAVNTFANGGTTPSATTNFGFGASQSAAGVDAQSYDFTINGTGISIAAGTTLANAITQINTTLGSSHAFEAYDNGGKLGIRAKNQGATALTIGGASAGLFAAVTPGTDPTTPGSVYNADQIVNAINNNATLKNKVTASNDNGKVRIVNLATGDLTVTGIDGSGNLDGSIGTSVIAGNHVRANLALQYNDLRDQLDKLAGDASFNGINLLNGDTLKVIFNETGTSAATIQAKDEAGNPFTFNSTSLGIAFIQPANLDFDVTIDGLLDHLSTALNVARSQASNFGSYLSIVENRQDFTKSMINTLQTGADNLTLADTNEEGANMLALQTRQQLSTTALSLAAQADQSVLRLFG
jgi:flagellin-like hook-associated protein FlgL